MSIQEGNETIENPVEISIESASSTEDSKTDECAVATVFSETRFPSDPGEELQGFSPWTEDSTAMLSPLGADIDKMRLNIALHTVSAERDALASKFRAMSKSLQQERYRSEKLANDVRSMRDKHRSEIQKLNSEKRALETEVSALSAANHVERLRLSELELQLEHRRLQHTAAGGTIDELQRVAHQTHELLTNTVENSQRMGKELEEAYDANAALSEQVEELTAQRDTAQEQAAQAMAALKELRRLAQQERAEHKAIHDRTAMITRLANKLIDEATLCRRELNAANAKLHRLSQTGSC